jgi:hypothetical protein
MTSVLLKVSKRSIVGVRLCSTGRGLDTAECRQQFRRGDLVKRSVADLTIELVEIPAFPLDRRLALFSFSSFVVAHSFPDCPEGVFELFEFLSLSLTLGDRFLALIEQLFGVMVLISGGLEPKARRDTERHILALAAETVAEEPN